MSFNVDRKGTTELGKERVNYTLMPKLFLLADSRKFERFEVSQFTATSELFCLHWVEKIDNNHYVRTMEHWDLEVIYNALVKMYDNAKPIPMDIAYDLAEKEIYPEECEVNDFGEDLL